MSTTEDRRTGQASIKAEFRKERWFDDDNENYDGGADADDAAESDKPQETKKRRFDKAKSKAGRGMNRGDRGKRRLEDKIKLCPAVSREEKCKFGETCRFSHDLQAYMASKPADLGDRCVNFDLFGKCSYGYKCRYLKAHLDENSKLVTNEEVSNTKPTFTLNGIEPDFQFNLLKKQHEYKLAPKFMKIAKLEVDAMQNMMEENRKMKSDDPSATTYTDFDEYLPRYIRAKGMRDGLGEEEIQEQIKGVGPIDTEKNKKIVDFTGKTYLAPLTTVGNLPFRRICKEFGVGVTCSEMALAGPLIRGHQSEWALTKRHVSEDIFGIQLAGGNVGQVAEACELLNETVQADFVDLNMGCPIDLIYNQGAGTALIDSRGKMSKMLRAMNYCMDIPVTVKFRTGIKDKEPVADKLVHRCEELSIPLGTIHGRSRLQRYTREADWGYIKYLKTETKSMKLFGNGDVMSYEEYYRHMDETGVDGIMIGRGALIKPWIFDEIENKRHWDISSTERFDMMKKFCNFGLEHWGSDSQGVNATRRFLCEWQSFLYRYIPIGLMEVYPQHINDRAPPYYGRDELETLMASPRASDWVKLTERILGPAPEDFQFIPKHKSNSFNVEG
ncbi:FMN-linked oxidoreductase [Hesseltinella vesiculosa]|uniref:tRNA-dihydrouridine(47) synthase [NAD(P)(+)] n=1 Tax=Hesseltinella vesiculosa TaxID=101127 RepID=A0A1X2GBR7_9FUNG|nr:FMN-linked oxidoreductase [Hesseltinella vesiculosa]